MKRESETRTFQKVIRDIICKVEASVKLFSKVSLRLAVILKLPKVYKIGQKKETRNESHN